MSSGREEGEIDSEEDGLRKRIHELENENAEYERIKRISECYEDKYGNMYRLNDYNDWEAVQRAGQVPTDVSSISSVEFPTPKKKKHKRKKNKCKMHDRHLQSRSHRCTHQRHKHYKNQFHGVRRHHHRRERLLNPYYESRIETILLDTSDNSDYEKDNYSIATMDIESPDEAATANTTLPLSREELRLALGRGAGERKNNTCPLRQRLQPGKVIELEDIEKTETMEESAANSNDIENVVEINSDNSMSIEEQELRLIALRSAIMRKHATRKKRNAEIAYSPTDFDDLLVEPVGSSIGTDIVDLDGDMEISPASSPHLLLSPIQCDEEGNSNLSLEMADQHVDNKPVDMELASSDSEAEEDNGASVLNASLDEQQMHDIPLPAGAPMESVSMPMSFNYANHGNVMPYDMYMAAMPYGAPLDMPQAVLPLPNLLTTTAMVDLEQPSAFAEVIPHEFATESEICVKNEIVNKESRLSASPKSTTMEIITEETQEQPEECSDEDEAEALRALLLSQRQAAKTTKMNGLRLSGKSSPAQISTLNDANRSQYTEIVVKVENIIKAQASIVDSSKPTPTESILKEAVRRLKVKTIDFCENVAEVPPPPPPSYVPRLKIKAFARCRDFDDIENAHAQPPNAVENEIAADHTRVTQAKRVCDHFTQQDESRSSNESAQRRGTSEILGIQSNSNENTAAKQPTKRHLEKEGETALTLRLKTLKQLSESQYTSEESNGEVLENSNNQHNYETYRKKAKIAIKQAPATVPNNLKTKEFSTKERNTVGGSGEKENQARTTSTPSKTVSTSSVAPKSTENAKPAAKTLKGAVKKKVNVAAATVKSITAPPKITVAPPPKIVKPIAQLKIVKPNKVINKNLEVPQKKQKSEDPSTQKKPEASTQQSRILTPTTLHNIKVNKFIIRLGDSSSEDEEVLRNQTLERCIGLAGVRTNTPDSLANVLNQNIYNNREQSTQSTQMEAASSAKVQTSEDISNASSAKETALSESFEKKLENFLKNIRSKTHQPSEDSAAHTHARVRKISLVNSSAQTGTPTAVRSLPIASQEEYKRLVHRMKILEKQKHLKKMQKSLLEDTEKYTKVKQSGVKRLHMVHNTMQRIDEDSQTISTGTQTSNDAPTAADENTENIEIGEGLIATVVTAAATEHNCLNEHTTIVATKDQIAKAPAKNEKVVSEKLRNWEKIYATISTNILTRLDKSLALVQEAKLAKIAKMRHEQRLQQLRLEMEQTQRKIKEEQMKITRIHPQICTNNELITKLRQKRAKVQEMAVKLGKSVQGDEYRLNNDLKNEITLKTKGLATHIKHVNSIRYCDLDILDKHQEVMLPDNSAQKSMNKKMPEKQRSIVEEVTKNVLPATTADNVVVENVINAFSNQAEKTPTNTEGTIISLADDETGFDKQKNVEQALQNNIELPIAHETSVEKQANQAEKTPTNIEGTTISLMVDESGFDKQKNVEQALQNNIELPTAHETALERQAAAQIVYQMSENPTVSVEEHADKQISAQEATDVCGASSLVIENTDNEQINAQETSENCDKLNEVQPTTYVETAADVACVEEEKEQQQEELNAPCDNGKEVLRVTNNRLTEVNVVTTQPAALETKTDWTLREYVSPLAPLRCESGNWDPNAIICPYELMGQCEDKDCNFKHFNGKVKQVVT